MLFASIFAALLIAAPAVAVPVVEVNQKRCDPTDTDILQYALTLEHLENAFFSGGLEMFDAAAFAADGYPSWVRDRFQQIADHEASHAAFLTEILGDAATKPCTYSFPFSDPTSFIGLSTIFEGVGVAAYLGASKFIKDPAHLTAAGAILTIETRHVAWLQSAVATNAAWSGSFETPLGLDNVFSLAAPFIKSCPESNPTLPVKAFPALNTTSTPLPGGFVTFSFDAPVADGVPLYAAFFSGLSTKFAPLDSSRTIRIPSELVGTIYVVISTNGTVVTDDTTIAGPTIFEFRLPESARQTVLPY